MTRSGRRRWARVLALVVALLAPTVPGDPARATDASFDQRMLELINRERAAHGVPALVAHPVLAGVAEDAPYLGCGFPVAGRAADMGTRNYFGHGILNCGAQSVFNMLAATGLPYSGAAENIAWVNAVTDPIVAAENLHSQLMGSSGHRANILNRNFTSVGIGSWHTAPGRTWSGAGFPLPNVYIVSQVFAGLPVTPNPAPVAPVSEDPGGRFSPLSPARILDTRTGLGGVPPLAPGATADVQVTGRGGIPLTGVGAVALTVVVTQPTTDGYLTAFPSGAPRPLAANLNFRPGETVSNLVVVPVGHGGRVAMFNAAGSSHVIVDVAGWYATAGTATGNAGRFEPLPPARLLDTRTGAGGGARLGPGGTLDLQVSGRGGVPGNGVDAAVLNLTVTSTTAHGYLTVYPTGQSRPHASNLNFAAGATVAGRAMVKLGSGGRVTIFNASGSTDAIVDVTGWYTDSSVTGAHGGLVPVGPARMLDTRVGTGGIVGALGAGTTTPVQVTGRAGVRAGARAVILNATVVGPAGQGYLTVFPSGGPQPPTSDVNFAAGDVQPNLVVVPIGPDGRVNVFTSATSHLIFDVAGWTS